MTTHTDFVSPAAAPAHDPWAGTQARPIDRTLYEAPGVPAASPPALRSAVPMGAPVALRQPGHQLVPVDRAPHHVGPAAGADDAPPSLPLPVATVEHHIADAPVPGTVPATPDDPWRALQHFPGPAPVAPTRAPDSPKGHGSLDADLTAAQFATVATSRARLDRGRAYTARLASHAADIRAKLSAASERGVAAAIGTSEAGPADAGQLRGELVTVDRQHRQAVAALADIEAEHARHEADFAALTGSDGAARASLAEAHAAQALAQTAAAAAKGILDRATAHACTVRGKLAAARADEARHDADATARLRAALADGDAPPAAVEPLARISGALEDDLRAATAAVDALAAEHAGKLAVLALAHRAVLAAVDGVLVVDAEQVARELHAADERGLALRTRLHCFTRRTRGDHVAPEPKPAVLTPGGWHEPHPDTARALLMPPPPIHSTAVINAVVASAPPPPGQGVHAGNWTVETDAWTAYASALAADPQAAPAFAARPAVPPVPPLPVRAA